MAVGVVFAGFFGVMDCVDVMALRDVRMVAGFMMVAGAVMLGCGAMVFGGLFVVFGGFHVVIRGVF
jgi:hypothetical protein